MVDGLHPNVASLFDEVNLPARVEVGKLYPARIKYKKMRMIVGMRESCDWRIIFS